MTAVWLQDIRGLAAGISRDTLNRNICTSRTMEGNARLLSSLYWFPSSVRIVLASSYEGFCATTPIRAGPPRA
jgi:hypothetical protein